MMAKMGFNIISYLDDFAACYRDEDTARQSFDAFLDLTKKLGLKLALHKSSPPSTYTEWLGYQVDTGRMLIAIPQAKLEQVLEDCRMWMKRARANKKMVQSIVGRLRYIANCVTPGRKFVTRILATLRSMDDGAWVTLTTNFKADIAWFLHFARLSNGIFLINPERPTVELECDSSMFGGGGLSHPYCYMWQYEDHHTKKFKDIHHLEAINILVAYTTLAKPYAAAPSRIIIWTDNIALAWALTTGRTKDPVLGACARQLWLCAATTSHEIEIRHKKGTAIPMADALSRMTRDPNKARFVNDNVKRFNLLMLQPAINNHVFFHPYL